MVVRTFSAPTLMVGVAAFGILIGATWGAGWRNRRLPEANATDPRIVDSLLAMMGALCVAAFFFDLLAFRQVSSLLFLSIGVIHSISMSEPGASPVNAAFRMAEASAKESPVRPR